MRRPLMMHDVPPYANIELGELKFIYYRARERVALLHILVVLVVGLKRVMLTLYNGHIVNRCELLPQRPRLMLWANITA